MSIEVNYSSLLTVVHTREGLYVHSGDATVTTNGLDKTVTLNSASTPPATKYSSGRLTLSSGAGTIDLTSLPNRNGVAGMVTFSGLKVSAYKLRNLSTNANDMTISVGASNGYELHVGNWHYLLRPGEEAVWKGVDASGQPDVGSGAKTIDVAGVGSEVLEFEFIAG